MSLRIANTEEDKWQPSNTYELIDIIATRNQQLGGVFIHQVRMIKQVMRQGSIEIPGLHVETFAFNAVTSKVDHPIAVAAALSKGAEMLAGDYCDPTGGDLISDRLTPAEKASFRLALGELAASAEKALALAHDGDEAEATAIWAKLFGDPFPAPVNSEAEFLKSLSFSTGAATRTRAWCPATRR